MALANRRPVAFPVTETASSSPSFKPRRLSLSNDYSIDKPKGSTTPISSTKQHGSDTKISPRSIKEMTPEKSPSSTPSDLMDLDASPTSTVETNATSVSSSSQSSSISLGSKHKEPKEPKEPKVKGEKKDKTKQSSRAPIATGISTTIPVTGERPKPIEHKSLDDDVLYAIFEILYENDPEGKGMTVKQICDILVEQHPEMAKLSTKTSNLVSAKLNAYVKRVEKGEKSLIYALSREWADASPKRMLYVYRGLLAPDYYIHALAAIENQKSSEASISNEDNPLASTSASSSSLSGSVVSAADKKKFFDSLKDDDHLIPSGHGHDMKRRATAFDLGITTHTFADLQLDLTLPQLSIPYSAAPVTASLGVGSTLKSLNSLKHSPVISDYDLEDYDHFNNGHHNNNKINNDEDDDDYDDDFSTDLRVTYRNNKRSKSMSYLSTKKVRQLTVAAAAPKFSKVQVTPSPSAAAAAAALHAAALEGLSPAGSVASGFEGSNRESISSEPPVAAKWLKAVRDGFLTQDIGAPEDISLAELDSLFT